MKIIEQGNTGYVYSGRFTGPVILEMLAEDVGRGATDVARVHFAEGAVTHWHSHPGGQLLLLVSGTGRVGAESGAHPGLAPGVLVETPPGERHWHGADAGTDAVWLAITWGVTDWEERSPL
ncbi:cupin domain-containing protein [Pseudonocardia sp. CA-107938]|uniref:cupin domain-containing protein n=1 Tax=Pseudonocardia sp. CA-107938 TaxID=3240021 RepID=UPI003D9276ED